MHSTLADHDTSDLAVINGARAPLDLTDLPNDKQMFLRACVHEYRSSANRVVNEMFAMTTQLAVMQEILGERFFAFVDQELGLHRRKVNRYLHINKVLQAHFSTDGRINVGQAAKFNQRALTMLTDQTEESVIDELKGIADTGGTINEKVVKEVLEHHAKSSSADLAAAQAEAATLNAKVSSLTEAMQNESLRYQDQLRNREERLRRAEENAQILEDELTELRNKPTPVGTEQVPVPTLPAGYTSAEEAVAAKTAELKALTAEITALGKSKAKAQEQLQEITASASKFLEMKEQVDQLIAKFPTALVQSMTSTDDTVKSAASALGQAMIQFGTQIASASAV